MLIYAQYYKPWETTQAEDDRIRDQIAEAHEIIRKELGEEAGGSDKTERGRGDDLAGSNADSTLSGKTHDAMKSLEPVEANGGPTDTSDSATKNPEQDVDHAEGFAKASVSEEHVAEDAPRNDVTSYEATVDESAKEVMDENGEEVVEAAEDTVIY